MRHARFVVVGVLLFGGCGGGGGGGSGNGGATTALHGRIVSRDGAKADLSGVEVALTEAGATVTTGADGSFRFDVPSGGSAHLKFTDPEALPPPDEPTGACGDPWGPLGPDPTFDPEGIDGDEVRLDDLDETEGVEIEVELAGGVVKALRTTRALKGDESENDALGRLTAVDGSDATGFAKLHGDPTIGFTLEVVASGFPAGAPGEFVLVDSLGNVTTGPLPTAVDPCGGAYLMAVFGYDPTDPSRTPNPAGWQLTLRAFPGGPDVLVGIVPSNVAE